MKRRSMARPTAQPSAAKRPSRRRWRAGTIKVLPPPCRESRTLAGIASCVAAQTLNANRAKAAGIVAEFAGPEALHELRVSSLAMERIAGKLLCAMEKIVLYKLCVYRSGDGEGWGGSYAERFDADNGAWELVPVMSAVRRAPAAVAIKGQLYVCGGGPDASAFSSAERFDP